MLAFVQTKLLDNVIYPILYLLLSQFTFELCCKVQCLTHREVLKKNVILHHVGPILCKGLLVEVNTVVQLHFSFQSAESVQADAPTQRIEQCSLSCARRSHDVVSLAW